MIALPVAILFFEKLRGRSQARPRRDASFSGRCPATRRPACSPATSTTRGTPRDQRPDPPARAARLRPAPPGHGADEGLRPALGAERGERRDPPRRRGLRPARLLRSEEHTSELQSRFGISYAVFCLKK